MSMSNRQKAATAAIIAMPLGGAMMWGARRLVNQVTQCHVNPMSGGQQEILIIADDSVLTIVVEPGEPLPEGDCSLHFALRVAFGCKAEELYEAVFSDRINKFLRVVARRVSDRP